MAEHAGYDQPGDQYPNGKNAYAMGSPPPYQPPYQPPLPPPQTGFVQNTQSNTTVVVSQQPQPGTVIIQARPPDYMVGSIVACLCCFFPTGLCAIYYANEANNLAGAGDYEGARIMSNKARSLMITSFILGILVTTIWVVLKFVVFEESNASHY